MPSCHVFEIIERLLDPPCYSENLAMFISLEVDILSDSGYS